MNYLKPKTEFKYKLWVNINDFRGSYTVRFAFINIYFEKNKLLPNFKNFEKKINCIFYHIYRRYNINIIFKIE